MRAIIKTQDEIMKEAIEETAKRVAEESSKKSNTNMDEAIKKAVKETAEEITKTMESKTKIVTDNSGGSKISQILKNANLQQNIPEEKDTKENNELDRENEKLKKEMISHDHGHSHDEDSILCPTCKKPGHTLKTVSPGVVKCTGEGCGVELALVPKKSQFRCTNCGLPHEISHELSQQQIKKYPIESSPDDICPFCNNNDFIKYDWSKVLKNTNKK